MCLIHCDFKLYGDIVTEEDYKRDGIKNTARRPFVTQLRPLGAARPAGCELNSKRPRSVAPKVALVFKSKIPQQTMDLPESKLRAQYRRRGRQGQPGLGHPW